MSTHAGLTSRVFASGVPITHVTPAGRMPVNQPDDITELAGHIFVAFQNGVGPQGEPTPKGSQGAGNLDSTVVEFSGSGSPGAQWEIDGHADGLTADPATGQVIATTNEDAHPHLFVIDPSSPEAVQYRVPALPHHGGFDAVSFYHGMMLVSASAPGTTGRPAPQPSYPAVYVVRLSPSSHRVQVRGLFGDEARARRINAGASRTARLALTDPDSNAVVPPYASRSAGQFELTSQGESRQLFVAGARARRLSVLKLSQSVDDSAWTSGPSGALYVTDGGADLIYKVTGPFQKGAEIVGVTPCDAGNAPASCPGPGFPSNYLGRVDEATGAVTKLALPGPAISPAGLLFVP